MKRAAPLAPLALSLAAALALHAPALRAPFFADDFLFLDQVRSRSLFAALASPDPIGNFYRPLGRQVHFWWLAHATGESPVAFHAANLLLLLATIVLLWALVRRVAGPAAAGIASACFALTHAADVPVLWAAGSQDLLAVALATGALLAWTHRRAALAAALLLAALLGKETVALVPVVAALLGRAPGETVRASFRRAWPMFATVAAWAAVAALAALRRAAPAAGLALDPLGPLASLVLLARTAVGLEWRSGGGVATGLVPTAGALLALVAAAGAAAWAASGGARARGRAAVRREAGARTKAAEPPRASARPAGAPAVWAGPAWAGLAWAVAGALPVAAVAPVWSAYYFLFAIEGVALALGVLLANRPAWAAVVVAVLGLGAQQARSLDEFATARGAWTAQSHVNAHYLRRGQEFIARGLESLHAVAPSAEPRTTFFFSNLPPFAAWQVADGPLVRWAYRDSSLRSYYMTDLDLERVRRGPLRFLMFDRARGGFRDRSADSTIFLTGALGGLLADRLPAARALLALERTRSPGSRWGLAMDAWLAWADGDTARAKALIERRGWRPTAGAQPLIQEALASVAAGDTARATDLARRACAEHALDPGAHGLLCDLLVRSEAMRNEAALEAYASRVLAPGWPDAWRRWGAIQFEYERYLESAASLERYFALLPGGRTADPATADLERELHTRLPGGVEAQRSLRSDLGGNR